MSLEIHVWQVIGISPLLQNNPAGTMTGGDDEGLKGAKKVYVDKDEAAIRVYANAEGNFVHPTAAFRAGLLVAAAGRKIGKRTARQAVSGAVFPSEVEAILLGENGKPLKDYEIDKRRVIVGKSGVLRCRPMYFPWCLDLALEVDRDFIPKLEVVTELLNIAGRICGIGDNRPDTSKGKAGVGTFGRYKVELKK